MSYRIGSGVDFHQLVEGRELWIGGVKIPHEKGALGHSDADVLLHAITDALLGAAGLGDIGEMFPDTAAENAGRDSGDLLTLAWQTVQQAGYQIVNLDCIVFAQRPKLSEFKPVIARRIADLLKIDPGQVGVKAKTGEKVGPIGRGEAIDADAVVLVLDQRDAI